MLFVQALAHEASPARIIAAVVVEFAQTPGADVVVLALEARRPTPAAPDRDRVLVAWVLLVMVGDDRAGLARGPPDLGRVRAPARVDRLWARRLRRRGARPAPAARQDRRSGDSPARPVNSTTYPVEEEQFRDLIRAREDVRGDFIRSRHRLSKLPFRRGIVFAGPGGA